MTTPARSRLAGLLLTVLALALGAVTSAPASAAAKARPPASGGPSCGTTIYKSAGVPWTCTFDDEFSGTSLDGSKWIAQQTANSGYTSGLTACFVNTPDNISVAGGTLNLTARKEAAPFTCTDPYGNFTTQYTSGMVSTYGRFAQAYGRFEVRAKLPAATVAGLQESFWLWPSNPALYGPWPGSGEIDMAEVYSQYADRAIPYIHYNAAAFDPNVTNTSCFISDIAAFHSYAVEWTTSTLKVIYDGQTCLVDDWNPASPLVKPQPFDQPFIIALTQALGIGTNAFDPATTPLPATTSIDYVRVWK
ncbi:glycoside hydrolase family 16 protein [Paraconexibacter antarcticus]|uniref:Glycoside hydrolase family 16 protein n=1 Tax=Paraconexibacter antarcticus TaxID=2949664 RepID=A0ABY5DTI6_9ACTN|nr:glycoside hydrolase family 16 protein [Paraconexibacter antarcticus]UTI64276.1 glycoside hydrolase family 16 protein [Paraconexibacter antarcticus]